MHAADTEFDGYPSVRFHCYSFTDIFVPVKKLFVQTVCVLAFSALLLSEKIVVTKL